MGEEGSGGFGGRRGVYLEKLLRGLCGWDLSLNLGDECGNGAQERRSPEVVEEKESRGLEGNEKEGRSEERRGGGGLEHRRAMLYPECEWTDVTLPVLTAVLGQRPTLSDETVLVVLERLRAALEVGVADPGGRVTGVLSGNTATSMVFTRQEHSWMGEESYCIDKILCFSIHVYVVIGRILVRANAHASLQPFPTGFLFFTLDIRAAVI